MNSIERQFHCLVLVLATVAAIAVPSVASAKGGVGLSIVGEIVSVKAMGTSVRVKIEGWVLVAGSPHPAVNGVLAEVEVPLSNAEIELSVSPDGFYAMAVPAIGIEGFDSMKPESRTTFSQARGVQRESIGALSSVLEAHARLKTPAWIQLTAPEIQFENGAITKLRSTVVRISDPEQSSERNRD